MSEELNSLIQSVSSEFSHGTIMIMDPYKKHYGTFHRKPKMVKGSWRVRIRKSWWKIKSSDKIGPTTYLFFVELPEGWWD